MTALTATDIEAAVLRVLQDTSCTAAEVAAVLGVSEHLAGVTLGLLAARGAVVAHGGVEDPLDALRRPRSVLWRRAARS